MRKIFLNPKLVTKNRFQSHNSEKKFSIEKKIFFQLTKLQIYGIMDYGTGRLFWKNWENLEFDQNHEKSIFFMLKFPFLLSLFLLSLLSVSVITIQKSSVFQFKQEFIGADTFYQLMPCLDEHQVDMVISLSVIRKWYFFSSLIIWMEFQMSLWGFRRSIDGWMRIG